MKIVTGIAPVNIAVIKYWGKRDEDLILPINNSISSTLSTEDMCSKTTIMASPDFNDNKFWLNGIEQSFESQRLNNCLNEIKKRAINSDHLHWHIHICSVNNFPTAAGLASSAAGYACLVFTLSQLYGVSGDISGIARMGSGSACRSVHGGWVQWHKGVASTGLDSIATQIAPADHWTDIRVIILVVNDQQKKYSSTSGMKTSVNTSTLLKYRSEQIVPDRCNDMIEAIQTRNFDEFAELTMRDSNQFHAICLDTYPPCFYMTDVSHAIIDMVHTYNRYWKSIKVCYTFDAGPNACLYLLKRDVNEVLSLIDHVFPSKNLQSTGYLKGNFVEIEPLSKELVQGLQLNPQTPDLLKYIISTKVGDGPQILTDPNDHLLNGDGNPKN